jgi:hypothetical protein
MPLFDTDAVMLTKHCMCRTSAEDSNEAQNLPPSNFVPVDCTIGKWGGAWKFRWCLLWTSTHGSYRVVADIRQDCQGL